MNIDQLFNYSVKKDASDLHIIPNVKPTLRVSGELVKTDFDIPSSDDIRSFIDKVLDKQQKKEFEVSGEVDFAYSLSESERFRVNLFKVTNGIAIAARTINNTVPSSINLGIPDNVMNMAGQKRGLILITGPTGSGKSTTLACMIDSINKTRKEHIITLEHPIEYVHKQNMCIVNQREVGKDTNSFAKGLRAALRQDPDIIMIGEMRDLETISIALTAAETGHLVLSTLHTIGAAKTIDRIVDVFPPHQQQQIRVQLSMVLKGVVSQQLIPLSNKPGRCVAMEIMQMTSAISNLIREGKTHQIQNAIQTGSRQGMCTMDQSLIRLFKQRSISYEDLMSYAQDRDYVLRYTTR